MVWVTIWIITIILCHFTIHYATKEESIIDSEDYEAIVIFVVSLIPIINLTMTLLILIYLIYNSKTVQKYRKWLYGN